MRTLRRLLVLAVVLLLVVIAAREATRRFGPSLLARLGVNMVQIDGLHLTRNTFELDTLSLVLSGSSGPVGIDLGHPVCHFRLLDLLHGKVAACDLAEAVVRLPPSQARQADNQPPDPVDQLRRLRLLRVPVDRIRVERFQVQNHRGDTALFPPLTLTWTAAGPGGELSVRPAIPSDMAKNSLALTLRTDGEVMTGDLSLPLALLAGMLPPVKSGEPLAGRARVVWQLPLAVHSDQPTRLDLTLSGLRHPQITVKEIQLRLDGLVAGQGNAVTLSPASSLTIRDSQGQGWGAKLLGLNLAGSVEFASGRVRLRLRPSAPWRLDGLAAAALQFASMQISVRSLEMDRDSKGLTALAVMDLPGHDEPIRAQLQWVAIGTRQGQATIQTSKPILLAKAGNPLGLLVKPSVPIVLQQGTLTGTAQLKWSPTSAPDLRLAIDLREASGLAADLPFSGLRIHQEMQVLPPQSAQATGRIELAALPRPVSLTNLSLQTALIRGLPKLESVLMIREGSLELLGGRVESNNCQYNLSQGEGDCLLTVRELDLAGLLAAHSVSGLSATGRLSGALPIRLGHDGIRIEQGRLANMNDGAIRYRPAKAPPPGSPFTDTTLKALEELRYHRLLALIDYQPDGRLRVRLEIRGTSPNLDPDQPVHLNIDTDQNLLSLLRSLRAQSDATSLRQGGP